MINSPVTDRLSCWPISAKNESKVIRPIIFSDSRRASSDSDQLHKALKMGARSGEISGVNGHKLSRHFSRLRTNHFAGGGFESSSIRVLII